ncbi:MAG: amidohydrolase family protein [Planctomyces sp.]|nr:amidohydrolase family protein [Planctomyces sp.]
MIIDSHQHFWKLDLPFDYAWLREPQHAPICRDYLPETLQPHLSNAGVDQTIFVQTQHNLEESRWVLEMARSTPFIAGVVGWVDLASDACEDQLMELKSDPLFVGVRHVTQGEPDENFIVSPEVVRGLKVLQKHQVPFDLLFYVQHLRHAPTLAEMLPDLPMVIDHLSKPKIREHQIDSWKRDLQAAAKYPNLYCKLSGMVTEADWTQWTVQDLQPYVEVAIEAFGPERCMFGSDWPVCELAGTYHEVLNALKTLIANLTPGEQAEILHQTATRFYKLKQSDLRS